MFGCILFLFMLGVPRLLLLGLEFFKDHYITSVFAEPKIWPIVGFLFAPLTTLAWAWSMHEYGGIHDAGLICVIVAAIIDSGFMGSHARAARKRRKLRRELREVERAKRDLRRG